MSDIIKTPHGNLQGKKKETFHCEWFTWRTPSNAHVEACGLRQIVRNAYGNKYLDLLESPNDTSYSVEIKGKSHMDEYLAERIAEKIQSGGFEHYYLNDVLQDLVNRDVLPPGNYVINVSW